MKKLVQFITILMQFKSWPSVNENSKKKAQWDRKTNEENEVKLYAYLQLSHKMSVSNYNLGQNKWNI